MKKKLFRTLLTILPLTATPLIAASCGTYKSFTKIEKKGSKKAGVIKKNLATQIKDKITDTSFNLAYQQDPDVTASATLTAIKTALKSANPTLTDGDLSNITFPSGTLLAGRSINLVATIAVDGYGNKVILSVKMAARPGAAIIENLATKIKDKITTASLDLSYQSNPVVTNPTTTTAIKVALKTANPTLTDDDLSKITFSGGPLREGQRVDVVANILKDGFGNKITLKIKMTLSPADVIKNKITTTSLSLAYQSNPDVTNPTTEAAIKAALKSANPTLTTGDLNKIQFNSATLREGQSVNVVAVITASGTTARITLAITMSLSPADVIKNKITDTSFNLAYQQNPDVTNPTTATEIKAALKVANPTLTNDDLAKIQFNSATLLQNQSVNVVAVITANGTTANITLSIKMAFSPANIIKNKITDTTLNLAYQSNPAVTNPTTATAIKSALKTANPTLTNADLGKIQFNSATLRQNQSVNVVAVITASGTTANITLSIKMAFSAANVIKNKITTTSFNVAWGANTSVTNPATTTVIKAALKTANPTLTNDDLGKIIFSGGPLVTGSAVNITAKITAQSTTATVALKVTMQIQTWTQSPTSKGIPTNANIYSAPKKIGNVDYLGTDGQGLFTSTDENNWNRTNARGIPTNAKIRTAPVKIGSIYYVATYGSGLYQSRNGKNWNKNGAVPSGAFLNSPPVKIGSIWYLTTLGNGLYTSSDGVSWTQSSGKGFPTNARSLSSVEDISGIYILTTNGGGLYTSDDGTNWTQSSGKGLATNEDIRSAPALINNVGYLPTFRNGLYTSSDGENWSRANAAGIPTNISIVSAPVKIGSVYYLATYGNGIYTSTNGKNWNRNNAKGLPSNLTSETPPVKIGSIWYLGTVNGGLYTSTDGINWTRNNAGGVPSDAGIFASPVAIGSVYYLGIYGKGLWTSKGAF